MGVHAALGLNVKAHMTPQLCVTVICGGIRAELKHESRAGFDLGLSTKAGQLDECGPLGCNEWVFQSEHTRYAEYTKAQVDLYNNVRNSASTGSLVLGGGAWLYVTQPYFRLYLTGFMSPAAKVRPTSGCGPSPILLLSLRVLSRWQIGLLCRRTLSTQNVTGFTMPSKMIFSTRVSGPIRTVAKVRMVALDTSTEPPSRSPWFYSTARWIV